MFKKSLLASLMLLAVVAMADISVEKKCYRLRFCETDGRVLEMTNLVDGTSLAADSDLWKARLMGEMAELTSGNFIKKPYNGRFSYMRSQDSLVMNYRADALSLDVVFEFHDESFDYCVENLRAHGLTVTQLAVPAEFVFPVKGMKRFLFPTAMNWSMGICFLPDFFMRQTEENAPYVAKAAPINGYERLFGTKLKDTTASFASPQSTEQGKKFYSNEELTLLGAYPLFVGKNPGGNHFELAPLCVKDDLALGLTQFGGKGYFVQPFGQNQRHSDQPLFFSRIFNFTNNAIFRIVPELFKEKKVVMIEYPNSPAMRTKFDSVSVNLQDWHEILASSSIRDYTTGIEYAASPEEMRRALTDPAVCMIINPYGDIFPGGDSNRFVQDIDSIKAFVQRGGIWWESGKCSFEKVLEKQFYRSFDSETRYPSSACDFTCASYKGGNIALFGIQPLMRKPWDRERLAVPASYSLSSSEKGANFTHYWILFAGDKYSAPWKSSPYRIKFSYKDPQQGIAEYKKSLDIIRTLQDKVPDPKVLERFKNAMLIRMWHEDFSNYMRTLPLLPPGNIAHFIGALWSRFDSNYPEHLPPGKKWGTLDDLTMMLKEGKKYGHLMMPYSNTTWWCPDESYTPSPSMRKWMSKKEEVMEIKEDGTPRALGSRGGPAWTVCHWHPGVQEPYRTLVRQYSKEYPCDLLFHDEAGGTPWRYDLNPMQPYPATAQEGRHSMPFEGSYSIPVATEDGCDRVLNFDTLICGGTWRTFSSSEFESRRYKNLYRRDEWQFYPIMTYVGHDNTLFTTHNLGGRLRTPEAVSLALSFGYKMNDEIDWMRTYDTAYKGWSYFLDAIQKTIASEYEGKALREFRYPMEGTGEPYANTLVFAEFDGGVKMICNHGADTVRLENVVGKTPFAGDEAKWLAMRTLPPYGFYASSPDAMVGHILVGKNGQASFALGIRGEKYRGMIITNDVDAFTLPALPGWKDAVFDVSHNWEQNHQLRLTQTGKELVVSIPEVKEPEMPDYAKTLPPKAWKTVTNKIAVINYLNVPEAGMRASGKKWQELLTGRLKPDGFDVVSASSPAALLDMLNSRPPERPFAVINPYGGTFCGPANCSETAMLNAIKGYISSGGVWFETRGQPFREYSELQGDGMWRSLSLRGGGAAYMGFAVSDRPVPGTGTLKATAVGSNWFGEELTAQIGKFPLKGMLRAFTLRWSNVDDPSENITPLVKSGSKDYFASLRIGWGYIFRVCADNPDTELSLSLSSAAVKYLYNHPWQEPTRKTSNEYWLVK